MPKFIIGRHLESLGIYESSGYLRKSQWKFDVNHRRHYATTVGIYESSGYLHESHWYKSQRIFTQFVTKFCSGKHLVMLQEFTKVVDVYKNALILTSWIPIGHVPHKAHTDSTQDLGHGHKIN